MTRAHIAALVALAGVAATGHVLGLEADRAEHAVTIKAKIRHQLALERDRDREHRRRIGVETRRAQERSVMTPALPAPPPAIATGVTRADLASQLALERRRRKAARSYRVQVLAAWRATVPDVPPSFIAPALRVASCESGDGRGSIRWGLDTGNGFWGAFQFHPSTYATIRGWMPSLPAYGPAATPKQEVEAAYAWWRSLGGTFRPPGNPSAGWPVCGLRA